MLMDNVNILRFLEILFNHWYVTELLSIHHAQSQFPMEN